MKKMLNTGVSRRALLAGASAVGLWSAAPALAFRREATSPTTRDLLALVGSPACNGDRTADHGDWLRRLTRVARDQDWSPDELAGFLDRLSCPDCGRARFNRTGAL